MKALNHLYLLCLLLLLTGQLQAQTYQLQGRVIDKSTGSALAGANLYLTSDWSAGTATKETGHFTLLLRLENQLDTLLVSFIGYREVLLPLSRVKEGQLLVALEPIAKDIPELVVEGKAVVAEEFTFHKLKRLDIYTNPAAKADPLLAVNSLPAATTQDESASISLRGGSPSQTGIFFNEVPVYDAVRFSQLNGIGTFSIFNTAIIDQLLVFPGNPPLEYGNCSSGLIALHTTDRLSRQNTHSLTLSLASFGGLSQQAIGKKSNLTAFANYQPAAFMKAVNAESLEKIQDFNMADAGLYFLHKPSRKASLKVFSYATTESYDFLFQHPSWSGSFLQEKSRSLSIANYQRHLGAAGILGLNGGFSYSKAAYHYSSASIAVNNSDFYLSANYHYAGKQLDVKTGIKWETRQQAYLGSKHHFSYALGEEHPRVAGSSDTVLQMPEAFSYLKYYLGSRWILGAGLRKNLSLQHQPSYLGKQLNLRHSFSKNLSASIAAGHYHQFSFGQQQTSEPLYWKSQQLSADINYQKGEMVASLSLFAKKDWVEAEEISIQGTEAFLEGSLLPGLKARLSYTYLNSNSGKGSGAFPGRYDLDWFIKGNLQWQFRPLWSFNTNYSFRQGSLYTAVLGSAYQEALGVYRPRYAPPAEQSRYPAYRLIDISLSRHFLLKDKLSLLAFASVNNLFNFKNVRAWHYNHDYSQQEQQLFAQRSLYFGLSINF